MVESRMAIIDYATSLRRIVNLLVLGDYWRAGLELLHRFRKCLFRLACLIPLDELSYLLDVRILLNSHAEQFHRPECHSPPNSQRIVRWEWRDSQLFLFF